MRTPTLPNGIRLVATPNTAPLGWSLGGLSLLGKEEKPEEETAAPAATEAAAPAEEKPEEAKPAETPA
jgi:hypothetical protein